MDGQPRRSFRAAFLGSALFLLVADGATAAPLGAQFTVNTYTTLNQLGADVAVDGTGDFVVVWFGNLQDGNGDGIFARRYDDTGAALGGEFQVNAYTTGYQRRPSVAMTSGTGSFVVVWDSTAQDGSGTGVFGQRFDSSGAAVGPEFQVNTYTTGNQSDSDVAADAAGNFLVAWSGRPAVGDDFDVFARRYDSSGAAVGDEFQVNTTGGGSHVAPAVAFDGSGNAVVAWMGPDSHFFGVFGQRYDSSGAALGGQFQANTYTFSYQEVPSVAADAAGNFVVAWRSLTQDGSDTGAFGRRFDSTGAPVGGELRINSYTEGSQGGPALLARGTEEFLAAWASAGGAGGVGIFGRLFPEPTFPVRGKKLLIRGTATPNKLSLRSTDDILYTRPDGGFDPAANGAFLHVYNAMGGPDSACMNLPASGWKATGDPAAPVFRYSDGVFANGPCRSVLVKNGKLLRAACSGRVQPLSYSLDETTQGAIGFRFGSGAVVYCGEFGGIVTRDEPGMFSARTSPDVCPPAPVSCP